MQLLDLPILKKLNPSCNERLLRNKALKNKNKIKYARQKCPVERQHFSINLNHQPKEIK